MLTGFINVLFEERVSVPLEQADIPNQLVGGLAVFRELFWSG